MTPATSRNRDTFGGGMKIKVSEATNTQLDWLVAKALGRAPLYDMEAFGGVWRGWWLTQGGEYERLPDYSTDWAQGGPIIEREGIDITANGAVVSGRVAVEDWCARMNVFAEWADGSTPLIAAMRCYVTSKLGGEAEVPEELS